MTPREEMRRRFEQPRPAVVKGVYVASDRQWAGAPCRFSYRRPAAWRIQYPEVVDGQLITDGNQTWVVEHGVAIVAAGQGKPLIGSKLQNLLDPAEGIIRPALWLQGLPRNAPIPWEELDVVEEEISDHATWVVRLPGSTIAVDHSSGVGVRWWSNDREIAIHDLQGDPQLPPDWFEWSGSQDSGRRHGIVYIAAKGDDDQGAFKTYWEVYLGGKFVYAEGRPDGIPLDVALTWARQRARVVVVRTADNVRYSAGEVPPKGEPLPTWPE